MPALASLRDLADFGDLIRSKNHSFLVTRERVNLIVVRARQIAAIFSVLTVFWIPMDAATVAWPTWGELGLGRAVTGVAFAAISARRLRAQTITAAYEMLGSLIATPLAFFLFANAFLEYRQPDGISLVAITAYRYVPFIVVAGLAIFPLTVLESAVFGGVTVLAAMTSIISWPVASGAQSALATIWLIVLLSGVSGLAGLSQLHFLLKLNERVTRDGLTGLLTREAGEELLAQQFFYSARNQTELAIIFLDLDNFKEVNDRFGHEAGDEVLCTAAKQLRHTLRRQDIPIRWGGEEFVIALPGTDEDGAEQAVRRMAAASLGTRPDGALLTASIGVAERTIDATDDLKGLIELADQRMYAAKQAGRNRYFFRDKLNQWLPA